MYLNLVKVKFWLQYIQISIRHLAVILMWIQNSAVLIRGSRLSEARLLLEEMRLLKYLVTEIIYT